MNEYKSTLTPEEVDAAFKNIALVEAGIESANTAANAAAQSASQAESSANAAAESQQQAASSASAAGQSATQSASSASAADQSASQAADSASAAGSSQQQAAASASASAQSASQAATAQQQATASASAAAQSQQQAASSAEAAQAAADQAQQISQGALGWYATPQALQSAHPTGQNGQWGIIGTTDTIWTWDSDTSAWVDSGAQVDLSNYYTKEQSDERYATAAQGKKADTAVQSVNGVSASAGEVTIPVGAQIELLWTNPSFESGSTFAPQTVSVDLSEYTFIMIEFLPFGQQWDDWTGKAMRLYPVGSTGNLEFMLLNQVGGQTGAIIECVSRLFYTSSSGVTFQNNVYTGDGGHTNLHNDWGVPTKIYGIKL